MSRALRGISIFVAILVAPTLYRVPITSNAVGTPVNVATLGTYNWNYSACSPVTEFYNDSTATDLIFVGVSANGAQSSLAAAALFCLLPIASLPDRAQSYRPVVRFQALLRN
jgi:hypothetical protein